MSIHRRSAAAALAIALLTPAALAQRPAEQLDTGEILHEIQKLGVLGSVLYLAAHPDDENTRLISYMEGDRKVRTAYLSLTRGDGGQNLIGPELGDGLGVIRTQELLEARRVDGGEQFFSRAVDFGYSKSAEETLAKWGKEAVLGDVVRVIRTFRPDVIVTRFDVDGSGGHGHHTASALLAREAFRVAADPGAYPQQIAEGLAPWQTKRLFFNGSHWWNLNLPTIARENPDEWLIIDVGGYNPLLGKSYNEIAARARSMHKSQGFGTMLRRGTEYEFLRFDLGAPMDGPDPLAGVDLSWGRVAGGDGIGDLVLKIAADYEALQPELSFDALSDLVERLTALEASEDSDYEAKHWARHHRRAAEELLLQVTGAAFEARARVPLVVRGESELVEIVATQRARGTFFRLRSLSGPTDQGPEMDHAIPWNEEFVFNWMRTAGVEAPVDEPYWLAKPHGALYDPPEGYTGIEPDARSRSRYRIGLGLPRGRSLEIDRHLVHTFVERVDGQRTRNAVVTPVASIGAVDTVAVIPGDAATVAFELEALVDDLAGDVRLTAPAGWLVGQPVINVAPMAKGEVRRFVANVIRTPEAEPGPLGLAFVGEKGTADRTMHVIDYPHIQPQVWYSPAEVRLVPVDVEVPVETVGYVKGAGDDLPRAMERLGITVVTLDPETAAPADLARCESIVIGIRAYNTVSAMARFQPLLMDFVRAGGTVLVQYNTASIDMMIGMSKIGPYPFELTRGRVTVEEAPPTFLAPEHPLMTTPNQLGASDFEGWVQERGLYFAGILDDAYTPLIAWSDPGEAPLDGALVTAEYGKGRFTYTGLSLFRQLPAGVPGAYRLLANLLATR